MGRTRSALHLAVICSIMPLKTLRQGRETAWLPIWSRLACRKAILRTLMSPRAFAPLKRYARFLVLQNEYRGQKARCSSTKESRLSIHSGKQDVRNLKFRNATSAHVASAVLLLQSKFGNAPIPLRPESTETSVGSDR